MLQMKKVDLTCKKLQDFANDELAGYIEYWLIAEQSKKPAVKKMFKKMADDEGRHYMNIEKLKKYYCKR